MSENESKLSFLGAMAKAQEKPPRIVKTQTTSFAGRSGGHVGYRYEDLAEIVAVVLPWLATHGFSVRWDLSQPEGGVAVTCHLSHAGGHSESAQLVSIPDESGKKNTLQQIGSTITYLRRYTLLAITGLAAERDDDDGDAGHRNQRGPTITEAEAEELKRGIEEGGRDIEKFCRSFGIDRIEELPRAKADLARSMIAKAIRIKKSQSGAEQPQVEDSPTLLEGHDYG